MYKVKRGTVKVEGVNYLPDQILPELDNADIKSLWAEKLIEEIKIEQTLHPLANLGISVAADKLEKFASDLEDDTILKVTTDDGQVESVIQSDDEDIESEVDADQELNVNFDIDEYVADPEKEEKSEAEPEHKTHAHKKGGK